MLWVILAAIGVLIMMVVLLNNNVKRFQKKISEWARALTELFTGSMVGDPGVQVAAQPPTRADEVILRNVRFLSVHKLLKDAAADDLEEILDMSWLERYNFVLLERSVPIQALREAFAEAGIDVEDLSEHEIIKMMPPMYCECADVIQSTFSDDNSSIWYADYKTEPIIINLEDDE